VGLGTSKESTPEICGEDEWRFHVGNFISEGGYVSSPIPYSGD